MPQHSIITQSLPAIKTKSATTFDLVWVDHEAAVTAASWQTRNASQSFRNRRVIDGTDVKLRITH